MSENLFLDKSLLDCGESDQNSTLMLILVLIHVTDKGETNPPCLTSENGGIRGKSQLCC